MSGSGKRGKAKRARGDAAQFQSITGADDEVTQEFLQVRGPSCVVLPPERIRRRRALFGVRPAPHHLPRLRLVFVLDIVGTYGLGRPAPG